jgi:hypothetical protein
MEDSVHHGLPGAHGKRKGRIGPMSASSKKNLSIVSLVLGLVAWLGEKFGLITDKVANVMNFGSFVTGAIATFG